ncbi:MAG: hypothetical protein C5S38_05740 [Candidatus Methanophagaceae archaeon]|nr:MAG: hypothetical protein C5S38_05740 [Methanophagales archaeon]
MVEGMDEPDAGNKGGISREASVEENRLSLTAVIT